VTRATVGERAPGLAKLIVRAEAYDASLSPSAVSVLTDRDREFLTSIRERLAAWGKAMWLSEPQRQWLLSVKERLDEVGAPKPPSGLTPGQARWLESVTARLQPSDDPHGHTRASRDFSSGKREGRQ